MDRQTTPVARKQIFQGVIRGLLPYYILSLLEEPHHGLEIAQRIEAATGGAWAPSAGTLYPMLRNMESDGWIQGEWQRSTGAPRRVYALTSEGRAARKRMRQELIEELELAEMTVAVHLEALKGNRGLTAGAHAVGHERHGGHGSPDPAYAAHFKGITLHDGADEPDPGPEKAEGTGRNDAA